MIVDLEQLNHILESGTREDLQAFAHKWGLILESDQLRAPDAQHMSHTVSYWDKRQLVKKINLNSAYGALLNPHCRFNDHRIGQSTTLSGRVITKHMNACVNECVTGEYDHNGPAVIYADTDSCYFTAWPSVQSAVESGELHWDQATCVALYNSIADQVNQSFPDFCSKAFNTSAASGAVLKCGRELVASSGLFITKKRYAVLIQDLEGKTQPAPGKLKAMGLDLKRADTPVVVQKFLSQILSQVLCGAQPDHIRQQCAEFKQQFAQLPAWKKGTPKRVNNLSRYAEFLRQGRNGAVPGHVRASLNWNTLRQLHADHHCTQILDGMKVIVCKLRPNPMNFTSVAYPIDEMHLPQWFQQLPFADATMETTIVDTKIENVLGVLGWDLTAPLQAQAQNFKKFFQEKAS